MEDGEEQGEGVEDGYEIELGSILGEVLAANGM